MQIQTDKTGHLKFTLTAMESYLGNSALALSPPQRIDELTQQ